MNKINEISDEILVPFLHDLGVETYKKSFEWVLNDPSFGRCLRWLNKNLDHNNALTAREKYRCIELEKKGCLLSPEDLESSLATLRNKYLGICVPGDHESEEVVEMDIGIQRERLNMLEKQELMVQDLITQNKLMKKELTLELARLSAAHQQSIEDEGSLAEKCMAMAIELEMITDDVVNVIFENLEVYSSCKSDKEIADRFINFAPLDTYMQTQNLFRSYQDLYFSKYLVNKQSDVTDEELYTALMEAKAMEDRLSDAALSYVDSKALLEGCRANLAVLFSYNNVHHSQIASIAIEAQSALELLEHEESILEQKTENSVQQLVKRRTRLVVKTGTEATVNVRRQMLGSLTHICDIWQHAFTLDRLLYTSLRHELRTLEEYVLFASQLCQYVLTEEGAIANRYASMREICADHESCELKRQSTNQLLKALFATLGAPVGDASVLAKLYCDLQANVKELRDSVDEGFMRKEDALAELKQLYKPLSDYIWDGCTKQPNCWDRTVAALNYALLRDMAAIDKRVEEASLLFISAKNGDKPNMRKLWQWFLTDPPKLLRAINNPRS